MLKPIENAEKLYNSFINKQSEKDFFIGFSDYFSYLDKHQELLACFIPELEKGNELNEILKNNETKAIEELLSQTMTKNCTRLQTSYNCSELNTKNTQRQTITIKPLWHKYYL